MNSYHSDHSNMTDDQLQRRRAQRRAKRRRRQLRRRMRALCVVLLLVTAGAAAMALIDREPAVALPLPEEEIQASLPELVQPAPEPEPEPEPQPEPEPHWDISTTPSTVRIRGDFPSRYGLLLELSSGEVLAERDSETAINPASMTKLLTLLVAAEHVTPEQLENGTYTMTREVEDYVFRNECSVVGYKVGEVIPVRELFYGCILNSGGDASMGLAETVFGSHEGMVAAMNARAEELGLSKSAHFTNCIGLYDEQLHCTLRDIAIILKYALENDLCREVLTTHVYQSVPTPEHTEGQVLSNLFARRIQNQDTGSVTVQCAKTGYVSQSGFCAASYGETADGRGYICVTAKSTGTQQSVLDHAELYRTYCPDTPEQTGE